MSDKVLYSASESGVETKNVSLGEDKVRAIANREARDEIYNESRRLREDLLVVFGIFASLFIFISVEISILQSAESFSELVGFSLFLLSSILSFVLALKGVVADSEWKDYRQNPVAWFALLCFLLSMLVLFISR